MNELNQQARDLLDFYKAQIVDLNQQLGQRIERIEELEALVDEMAKTHIVGTREIVRWHSHAKRLTKDPT